MNKAILIGNLTKDPELRTTQGGTSVCTFTLAINRRFTDADGKRQADFLPIVAWRNTADLCARFLAKGRKCAVVGTIQTRSYDAQDGTKRFVTEVVADEVELFFGDKQGGSAEPSEPPRTSAPTHMSQERMNMYPQDDDDDLPF